MTVRMEREPDILDTIDAMGLQERGTLRAWMTKNHDAFAQRLERFKPDWPALAAVFANAKLTDRRGNPPTAEATRKTWFRVHRAEAGKAPAATKTKPEPVKTPPTTPDAGTEPETRTDHGFSLGIIQKTTD
jgi:hypothetical protein